MSSSSVTTNLYCIHTSHLFSHPLCEGQSLLKRIANVAFHVLLLGIPVAIYHIFSCYYAKKVFKPEDGNLQTTAINSVSQVNRSIPNLALNQEVEKDMKNEIASKITERYEKILNLLLNNPTNPLSLSQSLIDNQLQSLALEINTIWANHNLKLLEKSKVGISREKIHEVLDVFIEHFPLLQKVKDLIASV